MEEKGAKRTQRRGMYNSWLEKEINCQLRQMADIDQNATG